jgi:hypothetical protein
MSDVNAVAVPERDLIRVDLPGSGHYFTTVLTIDQATRLATALKVALARLTPPPDRPKRSTTRGAKND